MRAMGSQLARWVADELDLDGVERMLDVGGGFGHYALAMCRARPGLEATVLDTPQVAEMAPAEYADTQYAQRIRFVGGDYLSSDYGSDYDLVLLANVLHQEAADCAAEMVRRSAAALAPGGRVVVLDFAIDDAQRGSVIGALFAINMRSFGDTHTEPAIRGWMEAAGLERVERHDLGHFRWLISGYRPA
jgi:SAM-dependent methyltransferase